VLRLQHEVVVVRGCEDARDLFAGHAVVEDVIDQFAEIGPPAAEVVVDIDGGDVRRPRAPLQRRDPARHRHRLADKRVGSLERHVVDDIDEQQRDRRIFRDVAVQVGILRRAMVHG
jgi:hypothetical protein